MTTSRKTSSLSRPKDDERIPLATVGYFRARNRNNAYDAIVREFLASGVTKATIARRLGKRPEVVSRLLGAPGNWTLDTISDLLLAISGSEVDYDISSPFDRPQRNYEAPDWIESTLHVMTDQTAMMPSKTAAGSAGSVKFEFEPEAA